MESFDSFCRKLEQNDPSIDLELICWTPDSSDHDNGAALVLFPDYSDDDFIRFGQALAKNTTVHTLKMAYGNWNEISARGAQALAKGICQSRCNVLELQTTSIQYANHPHIIPKELYGGLCSSNTLRELHFYHTEIEMTALVQLFLPPPPSSLEPNLITTNNCIHLETLIITQCPLSTSDLRQLSSSSLKGNQFLWTLSLQSCDINDEGVAALCKHLSENVTLHRLILSYNDIGPIGAQQIMRTIAKHPTLWKLNLSNNQSMSYQGLKAIGEELPHMTSLGVLKCEFCCCDTAIDPSVTDEACQAIADGLRRNVSLRELRMPYSFISGVGIKAIVASLANHPTMEILDLSNTHAMSDNVENSIGVEITSLSLKELYLERCMQRMTGMPSNDNPLERIRDSIASLATGVSSNSTLQVLQFSGNSLSPAEARLLMRALAGHPSMITLDLNENDTIGFDGLKRVADELPALTLQHLSLEYIHPLSWSGRKRKWTDVAKEATMQAGRALVSGMKSNFTLFRLDFSFPRNMAEWQRFMQPYVDEVDFYLKLNSSGRYLMRGDDYYNVVTALWPHILEHNNNNPSNVYYFLREQPWLL